MTTTPAAARSAPVWRVVLLAALAAVAALLLPAAPASAASVPAAGNGVGAITTETIFTVGVHESVSAGGHRVRGPSQLQLVSGHCVAAEDVGAGSLRFSQTTASSTFRNGPLAGRSIGDVASGLRSGAIKPGELPVDVINRGGNLLSLNTRSTLALMRGGVDPADWVLNDVTGDAFLENVLTQRLASNLALSRRR